MRHSHHTSAIAALVFATATPLVAGTVVMDFDHLAGSNVGTTHAAPILEDGLRLSVTGGNTAQAFKLFIGGNFDTGHKALTPKWTNTTSVLTAASGSTFDLVSLRLSPLAANLAANVTFVGTKPGGATVSQTFPTGTALAGTVRTFGTDFQGVLSVSWLMDGSGAQYHQFDDITARLPPLVTVPADVTLPEAAGTVPLTVRLGEAVSEPLTLTCTLTAQTASVPADAAFVGGGSSTTVTFTPGGPLERTVNLSIVNDTATESPETLRLDFATTASVTFENQRTSTVVTLASDDGIANFAGWMSAHALTGNNALPDADPNGDGVSNVESWLLRLNPAGPSPAAWLERRPALSVATGTPVVRVGIPVPAPSDVRVTLEETTNHAAWSVLCERAGFGVGSLWSGPGASRVTDTTASGVRTLGFPAGQSVSARRGASFRMKYQLVSGGAGGD